MSDLIGRTLGHYCIVEKIGEGGMGEVYRAHDEKLDRNVAVKVLPEEMSQDAERLARFEREAKLLASLNHSNIATLHGLEEVDGRRFLAMELVEGESLAGIVGRGAIPVDEALPIAIQIAEGLEAAHEHGVVHRDLKPANVMVTVEGKVKVLDFGLAKALDPDASAPSSPESIAESPTITAEMTRAGTLLGTAAYMSPEQARGKAVDKKADVWAFGCVLYEMLVGARAFPGTTSTEVLAGIIKEEPDWNLISAETPNSIRRLLRRCLTKDPRDRLHDIADARIELQALQADGFYEDESAAPTPVRSGWLTWLLWSLTVVTALGVGLLTVFLRPPPQGEVTKVLVDVNPANWLGSVGWSSSTTQYRRLSRTAMALSPDGRFLVFSAGDETGSRLYLRAMDEIQASPINGTEGGGDPFFSPDGDWIGFWADGNLKKVRIEGGPPVPICDFPKAPVGADWGPNDTIVFGQYRGGVLRVSSDGGAPEEITAMAEGEFGHRHPQLLPDGNTLFFTAVEATRGKWNDARIVAQSLETGERTILVENGADPRYVRTGHLVFMRQGALMAVPFDPKRLRVIGAEVVVLNSVRQGINAKHSEFNTYSGQFDLSKSGNLIHVPGGVWPEHSGLLALVDREGVVEPINVPPSRYVAPRFSADGGRIVVDYWGFEESRIWVFEIARGTMTRLDLGDRSSFWPVWTPDGTRITFLSPGADFTGIGLVPADGSGKTEFLLADEGGFYIPASWSPDGRVLAALKKEESTQYDIWMVPLEGMPTPFIVSPYREKYPTFSPNGRWLAYGSDQSGRSEIYVTPYPGPGPRIQISTDGGVQPVWVNEGRELVYRSIWESGEMDTVWAVDIMMEPSFVAGKPHELFKGEYVSCTPLRNYDISPDGQRFIMVKPGHETVEPVTQLHVTLDWFEELKRLAPTE